MDDVDDNKGKENRWKALVLKWGNHKHRILINKDVDPGLPKHKECPAMVAASSAALPWNLRTRSKTVEVGMEEGEKKISKAVENDRKINVVDEKRNLRSTTEKKEPVMKLAVPLSKSDIEEDFLKMIGKKPPSRPKKRSRLAQQDVINVTHSYFSFFFFNFHCNYQIHFIPCFSNYLLTQILYEKYMLLGLRPYFFPP